MIWDVLAYTFSGLSLCVSIGAMVVLAGIGRKS